MKKYYGFPILKIWYSLFSLCMYLKEIYKSLSMVLVFSITLSGVSECEKALVLYQLITFFPEALDLLSPIFFYSFRPAFMHSCPQYRYAFWLSPCRILSSYIIILLLLSEIKLNSFPSPSTLFKS